jgi:hypothetical protein
VKRSNQEFVSRRGVFNLFGLAIASGLAIPGTILTVADAEARVGNPASAVSVAGANRRDDSAQQEEKEKVVFSASTSTIACAGWRYC